MSTDKHFISAVNLPGKIARFVNYVLDSLSVSILFIISAIIISGLLQYNGSNFTMNDISILSKVVFSFLLWILYYATLEYILKEKSLGKFITGTRVINENNSPLTFKNTLVRTLCRLIPFNALSYLFSEPGKGWHDKISKTKVIND